MNKWAVARWGRGTEAVSERVAHSQGLAIQKIPGIPTPSAPLAVQSEATPRNIARILAPSSAPAQIGEEIAGAGPCRNRIQAPPNFLLDFRADTLPHCFPDV